jgi:hypothetical protein
MIYLPVIKSYGFNAYRRFVHSGSLVPISQYQASELMRKSSLSFEQQKKLFSKINTLPYALHAISGGNVDPSIAKAVTDKVVCTQFVLNIFQQYGTVMPYDIQKALIDAFAKSNESEADKSNHAFQLTKLVSTPELLQKLTPYIKIDQKSVNELSSHEAAYFFKQYEGDIATPVQVDLLQKINNAEHYAIALGSGLLNPDLAEKVSSRILNAIYIPIALDSDAVFSDAVWTNLIKAFNVTSSIKDKVSCVQAIKSNVNLSPKFKNAILEDLSNSFSSALSGSSNSYSDKNIELLADTLLANEDCTQEIRSLAHEYKDNKAAIEAEMNMLVSNADPARVFAASFAFDKGPGVEAGDSVVGSANDNAVASEIVYVKPKSIDELLDQFSRQKIDADVFVEFGIEMLSDKLEQLKVNATSIHFHFSTLVSLAKALGENLENPKELANLLQSTHVGKLIESQVNASVLDMFQFDGLAR